MGFDVYPLQPTPYHHQNGILRKKNDEDPPLPITYK